MLSRDGMPEVREPEPPGFGGAQVGLAVALAGSGSARASPQESSSPIRASISLIWPLLAKYRTTTCRTEPSS
ncbi:hypothetical protein A4E84_39515 [Streptomyces qaidamensis]|uniref:Uncharacterized protein n=1 Tax=Streptomyces qaidamensis TaxID=1783515 RepID=A0A143CCN5_9ACTN|nr:hypothetical protein A4E84_39515 [Streptomyces qaidamensis]